MLYTVIMINLNEIKNIERLYCTCFHWVCWLLTDQITKFCTLGCVCVCFVCACDYLSHYEGCNTFWCVLFYLLPPILKWAPCWNIRMNLNCLFCLETRSSKFSKSFLLVRFFTACLKTLFTLSSILSYLFLFDFLSPALEFNKDLVGFKVLYLEKKLGRHIY